MNVTNIIDLAKALIIIPSVSGDKSTSREIMEYVKLQLPDMSYTAFAHDGVPSLLYSNKKHEKHFRIILNVHLDVVPAGRRQFVPVEKNGKLYGRGAYDMKTAAAANILLFKELAPQVPYSLGLQMTTDEETGGLHGTAYQLKLGITSEFMLTAECGSNFDIIYEAKGMLQVRLTAKGKTSHSAYPWLGDNAILKLYEAIQAIQTEYPSKESEAYNTTVNVTHINTKNSSKHTVTPDHCEALLDVRYISDEKENIVDKLRALLPEQVNLEVIFHTPPHETKRDNKYIQKLQKIGVEVLGKELTLKKQHATSDARYYSVNNCDAVEFGPMGSGQHTADEYVDIKSVEQYYAILKSFLLSLH
jgi:succinyl-diaminopimelate desuccinylase